MALVGLENDLQILSYDENSPGGSLENSKKTQHNLFQVSPKPMVSSQTSNLSIRGLIEVFYEYLAYALLIKLGLLLKDVLDFDMNVIE